MKGVLMKYFTSIIAAVVLAGNLMADPISVSITAGDEDFAATRSSDDILTNMDFYVFKEGSGETGSATNSKGIIDWTYEMPNEITTAYSGSMTVKAWDIDPSDIMEVYFDFGGGNRVYAGLLQGSNGGNISTWESAVANGTTASLGGWSTTTFTLDQAALDALSGTSGFTLELNVVEEASSWAAVIDYATFELSYEPGAPNPGNNVPEPGMLSMFAIGLVSLGGFSMIRKRK